MLNEWSDREPDPEERKPAYRISPFLLGGLVAIAGLSIAIDLASRVLAVIR